MNTVDLPEVGAAVQDYLKSWVTNIVGAVQRLGKVSLSVEAMTSQEVAVQVATLTEGAVWMSFKVGSLGEHSFLISAGDALRLAQVLKGEKADAAAKLTQDHRDTLAGLFRQTAGAVGGALGKKLGSPVELALAGNVQPGWTKDEGATQVGFRLKLPDAAPLVLYAQANSRLVAALQLPEKQAQAGGSETDKPETSANGGPRGTNIDLLMDVDLEVTLRFGERQLLLKDLLELVPGSVVELDQQVQEPVELLVGKKVVARGEVVVVDGNYGLRVTEIANPIERIESLGK